MMNYEHIFIDMFIYLAMLGDETVYAGLGWGASWHFMLHFEQYFFISMFF